MYDIKGSTHAEYVVRQEKFAPFRGHFLEIFSFFVFLFCLRPFLELLLLAICSYPTSPIFQLKNLLDFALLGAVKQFSGKKMLLLGSYKQIQVAYLQIQALFQ